MSTAPEAIVARCGLVCSNCGAFTKGKCGGCYSDRRMFTCCPVRACTIEKNYATCAECTAFPDLKACRKVNSLISRIFSLVFRTDRKANLYRIREIGLEAFKAERQASGQK